MQEAALGRFADHARFRWTAAAMKAVLFTTVGILFCARQSGSMQVVVPTQAEVPDTPVVVKLRVHVIPTSYGAGPSGHKYPLTVSLKIPARLQDSISAYGAADRIWLAPEGWVGRAAEGADGSTHVELRPRSHSPAGPYVIYGDEGGCAGCAVVDAARYFPEAKGQAEEYGGDGERSPTGLRIHRISSQLVTFSFLGNAGATVHGAAFYSGNSDYYFAPGLSQR